MADHRDRSFWLSGGDCVESPPLHGEVKADVTVAGGGFTGLATAYFLKKLEPGLDVTLLESEVVGSGASGRSAGFSTTAFGFSLGLTVLRFGRRRALEAHRYMERAVDLVRSLVEDHRLDCEYRHPGLLRVATGERSARRLQDELALAHGLGLDGVEWLDAGRLAQEVRSPRFRGAWWERRGGLLNPAKLARGMKRVVESLGVRVHERTPVSALRRRSGVEVLTPHGRVRAHRLVLATNAWSHLVPGLERRQVPAFSHVALTAPLGARELRELGWERRQGVEDTRNVAHSYRLTSDDRLLACARSVRFARGRDLRHDGADAAFRALEGDVRATFPALRDVAFTHRWSGPVSVTLDLTPALGFLGDERVAYSVGCLGHGVSLAHMNGWTLAELALGAKTDRTQQFFVNRAVLPWPPEPLRFALGQAIRAGFELGDRMLEPAGGA